jgi:hypothetical protein
MGGDVVERDATGERKGRAAGGGFARCASWRGRAFAFPQIHAAFSPPALFLRSARVL